MGTYKISSRYTSGWYTVILPTAITLLVWAGVFLIPLALMNWTVPDWLGMLLCFGGFIPGLAEFLERFVRAMWEMVHGKGWIPL